MLSIAYLGNRLIASLIPETGGPSPGYVSQSFLVFTGSIGNAVFSLFPSKVWCSLVLSSTNVAADSTFFRSSPPGRPAMPLESDLSVPNSLTEIRDLYVFAGFHFSPSARTPHLDGDRFNDILDGCYGCSSGFSFLLFYFPRLSPSPSPTTSVAVLFSSPSGISGPLFGRRTIDLRPSSSPGVFLPSPPPLYELSHRLEP